MTAAKKIQAGKGEDRRDVREWLDKALELLADAYRSEVRFLMHLVAGEGLSLWQGAFASYEAFLKAHELVEPSRFTAFRDSVKLVGAKRAETIGVDGTIRCGRVQDPGKRETCVVSLEAWVGEHKHAPSEQTCARVVQSVAPVERIPNVLQSSMDRDRLEKENRALRARVKELEAEVTRLQALVPKRTIGKAS